MVRRRAKERIGISLWIKGVQRFLGYLGRKLFPRTNIFLVFQANSWAPHFLFYWGAKKISARYPSWKRILGCCWGVVAQHQGKHALDQDSVQEKTIRSIKNTIMVMTKRSRTRKRSRKSFKLGEISINFTFNNNNVLLLICVFHFSFLDRCRFSLQLFLFYWPRAWFLGCFLSRYRFFLKEFFFFLGRESVFLSEFFFFNEFFFLDRRRGLALCFDRVHFQCESHKHTDILKW